MYNVSKLSDIHGKPVILTINTSLSDDIASQQLYNLIILRIPTTVIDLQTELDETEEYFTHELNKLGTAVFIARTVDARELKMYFHASETIDEKLILILESKWDLGYNIIKDKYQSHYQGLIANKLITESDKELLLTIPMLFDVWKGSGIDTKAPFSVLFNFYSTSKDSADQLEQHLQSKNYTVHSKTKRTLLIFKGYITRVEVTQAWDQDELTKYYFEFMYAAGDYDTLFEGAVARQA